MKVWMLDEYHEDPFSGLYHTTYGPYASAEYLMNKYPELKFGEPRMFAGHLACRAELTTSDGKYSYELYEKEIEGL